LAERGAFSGLSLEVDREMGFDYGAPRKKGLVGMPQQARAEAEPGLAKAAVVT